MPHPITLIGNFNFTTLNKELELTAEEKKSVEVFLKAYCDDFWQTGQDTLFPPSQGGFSGTIDTLLARRYVFRNVIRECVSRVSGTFFGKAPNWKYQTPAGESVDRPRQTGDATPPSNDPAEEGSVTFEEVDKALSDFWTRQKVADVLKEAFESRLVFGRGGVRIYIPTKFKRQNLVPAPAEGEEPSVETAPAEGAEAAPPGGDFVQFQSITEAIKAMRVEYIKPTQGRLLDDEGELFSIVKYSRRTNWETDQKEDVIEFSFVDNQEATFIGTVAENTDVSRVMEANLSSALILGGRTTYNEYKGKPFVTKALYRNNMLLNLSLTCAGFSLIDNGFGEMILTNVELETETVTGADGEPVERPVRIKRGGGAVQNFMGVKNFDESTGQSQQLTPSVTFKDPTPITAFRDGASLAYESCLSETNQLYALITGDASPSGESRIQALGDHILRVSPYKPEIDEMGSWVLSSILLWAAQMANVNMAGYSVVYDSRMHVAILSNEEKRMVMEMREKGAISRETERVLLGVEDPTLESELVLREQSTPPDETTNDEFSERLDVGMKMLSLNIDIAVIQKFLGYTDAQIADMQRIAAEREAELLAQIAASEGGGTGPGDVPPEDNPTATGTAAGAGA